LYSALVAELNASEVLKGKLEACTVIQFNKTRLLIPRKAALGDEKDAFPPTIALATATGSLGSQKVKSCIDIGPAFAEWKANIKKSKLLDSPSSRLTWWT